MTDRIQTTPSPGSHEATERGCTCPVMDNAHGCGIPSRDGPGFLIAGDCPLHAPKELRDACRKADQQMHQERHDD